MKQELVVLDQSIFGADVQVSSGWPVHGPRANKAGAASHGASATRMGALLPRAKVRRGVNGRLAVQASRGGRWLAQHRSSVERGGGDSRWLWLYWREKAVEVAGFAMAQ